jgi:hypothetical protein
MGLAGEMAVGAAVGGLAGQGGRMIHCVDNSVRFGSRSAVSFC